MKNRMYLIIIQKAIYPIIDDINNFAEGYVGILGLKLKISGEKFAILEFYNGFQFYDFQAFLSVLDDDLLSILYSCANGCLADNYGEISLSDNFSYTIALEKRKITEAKDEENEYDFFESEDEYKKIYTSTAKTINMAKEKLLDSLENIVENEALKEIIDNNNMKEIRY